jgi:FtsH-binding integral membrane protein
MSDYQPNSLHSRPYASDAVGYNAGLRSFMLGTYRYMTIGLLLTAIVSYAVSLLSIQDGQLTNLGNMLFNSPLKWVVLLAPLGIVFFLSFRVHAMSFAAAQTTFWVYAALNGIALATIFMVYSPMAILKTFLVTSIMFGGMSIYGYTTKRDLTGIGNFLIMGVWGLLVAGIVNIFMQSPAIDFAVSAIAVLIFTGLTAYDTQKLKEVYYEVNGSEMVGKASIMGALTLYLDFINIFIHLLRLFGNRE